MDQNSPATSSLGAVAPLLSALAAGDIDVVDLTTPLSSRTPALVLPDPFVNLDDFSLEEVSAYNEPGPFWKHQNIRTGEHIGTHLDAPVHWISGRDGKDVSQIEPARLTGRAVVLDFTEQTAADPDFLVDVDHLRDWQDEHGSFESGDWLLFRTGWDARGGDRKSFLNADETGSHTPGFTAACAQFLAEQTEISGVGVETVGIDAGRGAELDPPFPMHNFLLGADKYGLTSLRNLDRLPTSGALIVVAPLPIVGGTGSPSRVFALVDGAAGSQGHRR